MLNLLTEEEESKMYQDGMEKVRLLQKQIEVRIIEALRKIRIRIKSNEEMKVLNFLHDYLLEEYQKILNEIDSSAEDITEIKIERINEKLQVFQDLSRIDPKYMIGNDSFILSHNVSLKHLIAEYLLFKFQIKRELEFISSMTKIYNKCLNYILYKYVDLDYTLMHDPQQTATYISAIKDILEEMISTNLEKETFFSGDFENGFDSMYDMTDKSTDSEYWISTTELSFIKEKKRYILSSSYIDPTNLSDSQSALDSLDLFDFFDLFWS